MMIGLGLSICSAPGAAFTPATQPMTFWCRRPFVSSPWAGVTSTGGSGSRALSEATNPPAVGSINGADFDGTNDKLSNNTLLTTLLSVSAYSGFALVNAGSVATNSADGWANDTIIMADTGTEFLIYMRSSGLVGINHHDGAHKTVDTDFVVGAWQLVQFRFTGSKIQIRVNDHDWEETTAGNCSNLTRSLVVAQNPVSGLFSDMELGELGLINTSWSDDVFDQVLEYARGFHDLPLT